MDKQHTCMIIDDEPEAVEYLASLVADHCPELKVVATATGSESAVSKYFYHLPDLIFMDIEVDEKNGFEILRDIYREKLKPYIIFVTAFNQYAVQAFKANAIDYLLKPVIPDDLVNAVRRFTDIREKELYFEKIASFISGRNQKIRFNTREGFIFLDPDEIVYCEADANYTRIFTGTNKFMVVSHNLGQVEKLLPSGKFWRNNRSFLVNLKYLTKVDRLKKVCYLECGGETVKIPVAPDHLKELPD